MGSLHQPFTGRHALQGGAEALRFQLLLEHFSACLLEQEVVGLVFLEDVKEQGRTDLQLPPRFVLSGHGLGDQAADLGDRAKATAAQL